MENWQDCAAGNHNAVNPRRVRIVSQRPRPSALGIVTDPRIEERVHANQFAQV